MSGDQEIAVRIRTCVDELRKAVKQGHEAGLLVSIRMLGEPMNPKQFEQMMERVTVEVSRKL